MVPSVCRYVASGDLASTGVIRAALGEALARFQHNPQAARLEALNLIKLAHLCPCRASQLTLSRLSRDLFFRAHRLPKPPFRLFFSAHLRPTNGALAKLGEALKASRQQAF